MEGEPITYLLEESLRGDSTLTSYKYIRLKVAWNMPLVSCLFFRDVILCNTSKIVGTNYQTLPSQSWSLRHGPIYKCQAQSIDVTYKTRHM